MTEKIGRFISKVGTDMSGWQHEQLRRKRM